MYHPPAFNITSRHDGVALIIVLTFLALLTGLVVAFFSNITTESAATSVQTDTATTRQLADSTVQVVMGQILQATSLGSGVAWASQPGMIRTWGNPNGTASANLLTNYKLYSSDQMTVTNNNWTNDAPSTWAVAPALYTDLNSPIVSTIGGVTNTNYPILSGNGLGSNAGVLTYLTNAGGSNQPLIEGFGITTPPVAKNTTSFITNQIPMPVKWLYVLQNGTLVAPDSSSMTNATFTASTNPPSATNPIVGRIAFWTDDETCKLNINTAAGGNPWMPPSFESTFDLYLSRYQPAPFEFNRYPGHPSTVSLQPILWSYMGFPQSRCSTYPTNITYLYNAGGSCGATASLSTTVANAYVNLMALSPRNATGGSYNGGTSTAGYQIENTSNVIMDADRIYASVDELIFNEQRIPRTNSGIGEFRFGRSDIDHFRFFITADSRAPEVNLYNLPKVSLWPEPSTNSKMVANPFSLGGQANRTILDQTIAFCSTFGTSTPYAYYFTRYDATSATNDFAPSSRNMTLYNYILGLLQSPTPGFGGTFDQTAGRSAPQILTECCDFIRACVNLSDPTGTDFTASSASGKYTYAYTAPPYANGGGFMYTNGSGLVVPLALANGTRGVGRFPSIKSATLMFIARRANQPPVQCVKSGTNLFPITNASVCTINPMHPWLLMSSNFISSTPYMTPTNAFVSITTNSTTNYAIVYQPAPTANYAAPFSTNFGALSSHPGLSYLADTNLSTITNPPGGLTNVLTNATFVTNPGFLPGSALAPNETEMEAIFFIDPVNNEVGRGGMAINYLYSVSALDTFKIRNSSGANISLFPNIGSVGPLEAAQVGTDIVRGWPAWGYTEAYDLGPQVHTTYRWAQTTNPFLKLNYWSSNNVASPLVVGPNSSVSVANTFGQAFDFSGGTITVRIYHPSDTNTPVQTLQINFPNATFPTPRLIAAAGSSTGLSLGLPGQVNSPNLSFNQGTNANKSDMTNNLASRLSWNAGQWVPAGLGFTMPEMSSYNSINSRFSLDTIRSVECTYGDTRIIACLTNVPTNFFMPHAFYSNTLGTFNQSTVQWQYPWARSAHTLRIAGTANYGDTYNGCILGGTLHALSQPTGSYLSPSGGTNNNYHSINPINAAYTNTVGILASFLTAGCYDVVGAQSGGFGWPHVTSSADFNNPAFVSIWNQGGDFANGSTDLADGPYIPKAPEFVNYNLYAGGNTGYAPDWQNAISIYCPPAVGLFCPSRSIPSAVQFGTLPRGVNPGANDPNNSSAIAATLNSSWQTLLFNPNPNGTNHPALAQMALGGAAPTNGTCPDFTLLDDFWMPVIQPYAISDPFSTAGKVNMNFQIVPFTYIQRDTALRGVLESALLTAVSDQWINYYKAGGDSLQSPFQTLDTADPAAGMMHFRYPIHADQTLQQFNYRFSQGDLFRSPSEICSLFLYPAQQLGTPANPANIANLATNTLTSDGNGVIDNIRNWWYAGPGTTRKSLTGVDNRNQPYASIYPLLTTKSNTYQVHFRVQLLKQPPGSNPAQWNGTYGKVTAEYRGSSLIERYVDPADPTIPDFATNTTYPTAVTLNNFYHFRVINTKKFGP